MSTVGAYPHSCRGLKQPDSPAGSSVTHKTCAPVALRFIPSVMMKPVHRTEKRMEHGTMFTLLHVGHACRSPSSSSELGSSRCSSMSCCMTSQRSRSDAAGAIRAGSALLAGLIVCGRCRMTVRYGRGSRRPAYVCASHHANYGTPLCQSLAGPELDQYVSAQVLTAQET
jgi:Recombinase zinc beta ribbon domain